MFSALLLSLALLTARTGSPMPYTLIYEQNFAAGNSSFSQVNTFTGHGSDALYPDAYESEGVQVNTGGGPSGENTLDWWPSHGTYLTSGFWGRVPTVATAPLTGVNEGAAEVWYKPNATSIATLTLGTADPLLWLFKYNSPGTSISDALFAVTMRNVGSVRKLRLQYYDYNIGSIDLETHTNAQPADTGWVYRVEFKEPTYVGDVPNSDGYIRLIENGVTIYENLAIAGPQTSGQLGADRGAIGGYELGYAGLWGEATNVRIYSLTDIAPQVGGTVPTCCDPGTGPGDTGTNPDPVGTLPPWTANCTTGGVVDTVADLTDGEVW